MDIIVQLWTVNDILMIQVSQIPRKNQNKKGAMLTKNANIETSMVVTSKRESSKNEFKKKKKE